MNWSASLLGLHTAFTLLTTPPTPPTATVLTVTPAPPGGPPSISASVRQENEILAFMNAERKKRNISSLLPNALLSLAAQQHAEDMARRGYFKHNTPEGKTPEQRIAATGYFLFSCNNCSIHRAHGENLARGQKTPDAVIQAWMKSQVHRTNILNPGFHEAGMGFSAGYWVVNFGTLDVRY